MSRPIGVDLVEFGRGMPCSCPTTRTRRGRDAGCRSCRCRPAGRRALRAGSRCRAGAHASPGRCSRSRPGRACPRRRSSSRNGPASAWEALRPGVLWPVVQDRHLEVTRVGNGGKGRGDMACAGDDQVRRLRLHLDEDGDRSFGPAVGQQAMLRTSSASRASASTLCASAPRPRSPAARVPRPARADSDGPGRA